jgi:EAL domain-containing protein (putative c-di-GMP-specific phosphodiesterase class I)
VAEGVETAGQRDEILAVGCDSAQGYFYARPMPAPAFAAMLLTSEVADGPFLPLPPLAHGQGS